MPIVSVLSFFVCMWFVVTRDVTASSDYLKTGNVGRLSINPNALMAEADKRLKATAVSNVS